MISRFTLDTLIYLYYLHSGKTGCYKKYVGSLGFIPVQPKIRKKKRTSVRKLRESHYILQEEEDVEASGLVTREIRNKKVVDAAALQKAM